MKIPGFTADAAVRSLHHHYDGIAPTGIHPGNADAKPAAMFGSPIYLARDNFCWRICYDYCRSTGAGAGYCAEHCTYVCR